MTSTLGALIRQCRKAAGLTQREVAEKVGINFTYLSKIETSSLEFPPSNDTIRRIAEAVRCDPMALMEASGKAIKLSSADVARYRRIEAAAKAYIQNRTDETFAALREALH